MSQSPDQNSSAESPGVGGGRLWAPMSAIAFSVSRSSGPGGQNVNKQNTRLELRVSVSAIEGLIPPIYQRLEMLAGKRMLAAGEIRIVSQATRSLEQNRQLALEQLMELFTEASKLPRPRRATRPSRGAARRRIAAKKRRGEIKAGRRHGAEE